MSVQKQERIVARKPDILVATPGRLWELLSSDDVLLNDVKKCRFLVLDEADRMLEKGHFQELTDILNVVYDFSSSSTNVVDDEEQVENTINEPVQSKRQTFVFSATLMTNKEASNHRNAKRAAPGSIGTMNKSYFSLT